MCYRIVLCLRIIQNILDISIPSLILHAYWQYCSHYVLISNIIQYDVGIYLLLISVCSLLLFILITMFLSRFLHNTNNYSYSHGCKSTFTLQILPTSYYVSGPNRSQTQQGKIPDKAIIQPHIYQRTIKRFLDCFYTI